MQQIEIVGMRKNRDLKIVVVIIILAIIGILICTSIILYNKHKLEAITATTNIVDENDTIESVLEEDSKIFDNKLVASNEGNEQKHEATKEEKNFINAVNNIYNGEEGKRVFLTFDDGPSEAVTPKVLDILDKYNIKATFFVLGCNVKSHPDIIKREYNSGHYIANHGYSHKYSQIYKNANSVLEEYNKTEKAIQDALGDTNYSSNLFRFPGGAFGGPYEKVKKKARSELNKRVVAYLDWSALTYDAEGASTEKEIISNLKETMNDWDNVVILMHDAPDKEITYKTLEAVIKYLQKNGYAFKNMYNL